MLHGLAHFEKQFQALRDAQLVCVAILVDRRALYKLHDEVGRAVFRDASVYQSCDVWMFETGQNLALGEKTPPGFVGVETHWQQFQRRLHLELLVVPLGDVHGTHPATTDEIDKSVVAHPLADKTLGVCFGIDRHADPAR